MSSQEAPPLMFWEPFQNRFRNRCTGCRQSFTRLHRGFPSLLSLFLGLFHYFTALCHICAWRIFDRRLHFWISQWHKLTSVFLLAFFFLFFGGILCVMSKLCPFLFLSFFPFELRSSRFSWHGNKGMNWRRKHFLWRAVKMDIVGRELDVVVPSWIGAFTPLLDGLFPLNWAVKVWKQINSEHSRAGESRRNPSQWEWRQIGG